MQLYLWLGDVGFGMARRGTVRRGKIWWGKAMCGVVRLGFIAIIIFKIRSGMMWWVGLCHG